MASTDLKRLNTRYDIPYTGFKFKLNIETLLTDILSTAHENITESITERNNKALKKGRLTLPKFWNVDRTLRLRKIKENGKLLTSNLRDKIIGNLREVLAQPHYVKAKGKEKGEMKTSIIQEFEQLMTETFKNYVKVDPRFGMPANIHAIAVTETRASVNDAKHEYINELLDENPETTISKTWVHNTHLLKNGGKFARPSHVALHGVTIGVNKRFTIKSRIGTSRALYPHDPELDAGEVVNCQCECVYDITTAGNRGNKL